MTTSFLTAFESGDVITKTVYVVQGSCCQEAVNLGEVAKGRSGEGVPVIDCPGHLASVERNRDLVIHRSVEGLSQVVVLSGLWIESAKEPEFVLNDWATNVAADICFRETIVSGSGEREIVHATDETFGSAVTEDVTMELVATTLRDDVEDTTGGFSVFRTV